MPVSQHAQYKDPGTSSHQSNAAIINIIDYTCAFAAMPYQKICCEKGLLFLLLDVNTSLPKPAILVLFKNAVNAVSVI